MCQRVITQTQSHHLPTSRIHALVATTALSQLTKPPRLLVPSKHSGTRKMQLISQTVVLVHLGSFARWEQQTPSSVRMATTAPKTLKFHLCVQRARSVQEKASLSKQIAHLAMEVVSVSSTASSSQRVSAIKRFTVSTSR